MFVHISKIRVRYCETDAMGFLHHSNYTNYYEQARADMFRDYGMSYCQMEQDGVMMPVLEVKTRFFNPAHYDDLLTVETLIKELPRVKITFYHTIRNQHGDLINEGEVTLAFMNSRSRRACRAPQTLLDMLSKADI